jgi:SAM-dependent methyltransferase
MSAPSRHPVYGIGAPELGWVPAPRYALRRSRVLSLLAGIPPGRALEVGCGAGALLADLADLGWACEALEPADAARALAGRINQDRPQMRISPAPREDWEQAFDLVLAFEVLEHLEDDAGALRQWRRWLRSGGRLMLSVPARQARWNATDDWAGHLRRYERPDLLALLAATGLTAERHECYGFPLSNVTEAIRSRILGRQIRRAGGSPAPAAATERSGTDRGFESRLYPLQASPAGVAFFRLCSWLQDRFLGRELGTGYLVLARRT